MNVGRDPKAASCLWRQNVAQSVGFTTHCELRTSDRQRYAVRDGGNMAADRDLTDGNYMSLIVTLSRGQVITNNTTK